LVRDAAPSSIAVAELLHFRQVLFDRGLIGVYPDGIGYGNISARLTRALPDFFISASQTGHISSLLPEHFVLVTDYDIDENWVECHGVMNASSESLTHAMIYEIFPLANAVIHIHNRPAWQRLKNQIVTSGEAVPYGTPDMAREVLRLARETDLAQQKIFVMGGHDDGILSFGSDLGEAYCVLDQALAIVEK
jgi:ribulose-5-phosphate 4-epimerase/fuculose-1-phosphate aldolase